MSFHCLQVYVQCLPPPPHKLLPSISLPPSILTQGLRLSASGRLPSGSQRAWYLVRVLHYFILMWFSYRGHWGKTC